MCPFCLGLGVLLGSPQQEHPLPAGSIPPSPGGLWCLTLPGTDHTDIFLPSS